MAALTATCFVYTALPTPGAEPTVAGVDVNVARGPHYRIENGVRVVRIRAAMTNALTDSTYPSSGGVPLSSSPGDWGMVRNLDYINMYGRGHTSTGLATNRTPDWNYAPTLHSMIGWETNFTLSASAGPTEAKGPQELATTWTPTLSPINTVFYFKAYGW